MAKEVIAEQGAAKPKQGMWAKFMHAYGSYKGKKVVNCIYSIGASVVIIGALFKIMHFPGAGPVLMAGMITEAFLFLIGCLEDPHPEFHWGNVFPQLLEYGTEPELLAEMQRRPKPTLLGAGTVGGEAVSAQGGNHGASAPALTDKEMESLRNGINDLAKTAVQLSELGKVATATSNLSDKLNAAGAAAEQFATAGKSVAEHSEALGATYAQVTADMQKVADGTKKYEANVASMAGQLAGLNAVYELQLKAVQAQVDAYNAQAEKVNAVNAQVDTLTTNVKKMTDVATEALKSQEAYEAGAKKLASQVADLNKVYGNMLNALA